MFQCEPINDPWYVRSPWLLAIIVIGATLVSLALLFLCCYRKGARPAFLQQYVNMRKRLQVRAERAWVRIEWRVSACCQHAQAGVGEPAFVRPCPAAAAAVVLYIAAWRSWRGATVLGPRVKLPPRPVTASRRACVLPCCLCACCACAGRAVGGHGGGGDDGH